MIDWVWLAVILALGIGNSGVAWFCALRWRHVAREAVEQLRVMLANGWRVRERSGVTPPDDPPVVRDTGRPGNRETAGTVEPQFMPYEHRASIGDGAGIGRRDDDQTLTPNAHPPLDPWTGPAGILGQGHTCGVAHSSTDPCGVTE